MQYVLRDGAGQVDRHDDTTTSSLPASIAPRGRLGPASTWRTLHSDLARRTTAPSSSTRAAWSVIVTYGTYPGAGFDQRRIPDPPVSLTPPSAPSSKIFEVHGLRQGCRCWATVDVVFIGSCTTGAAICARGKIP